MDSRFHSLRDVITDEAAKAYLELDGEQNADVILWETMLAASERSRVLDRLIKNPGVFIAAIYNTYGHEEYIGWRNEVEHKVAALQPVDHQG